MKEKMETKISSFIEQARKLRACPEALLWASQNPDATLKDLKAFNSNWYVWGMARGLYHPQAIDDYDKAIELNPELAEAYNNRGLAYYYFGYNQRAIEDYEKASELKRNS